MKSTAVNRLPSPADRPRRLAGVLLAICAVLLITACTSGASELRVDSHDVLLTVNGVQVTEQQIAIADRNIDFSHNLMSTAIVDDSNSSDVFVQNLDLMDEYGRITVALATVIGQVVDYTLGLEHSLEPDDELVEQVIDGHHAATERIEHLDTLVETLGEDAYWDYFAVIAEWQAMGRQVGRSTGFSETDIADALRNADIQIVGSHPAVDKRTVDLAIEFLLDTGGAAPGG